MAPVPLSLSVAQPRPASPAQPAAVTPGFSALDIVTKQALDHNGGRPKWVPKYMPKRAKMSLFEM